jgi:hypothetical protein
MARKRASKGNNGAFASAAGATYGRLSALKIMAGRDKDLDDCAILLPQTSIKTRQQAQQLLDRYILPEGQEKHAEQIDDALRELFTKKE